jgi:hypothetical protein
MYVCVMCLSTTISQGSEACGIKKTARVFSVPCSSINGRVCFASFDVLAAVYLTAPFSSGIVVSSLGDWFQKSRDHVMKNLDISTLKDEATTLPQNVDNLTRLHFTR